MTEPTPQAPDETPEPIVLAEVHLRLLEDPDSGGNATMVSVSCGRDLLQAVGILARAQTSLTAKMQEMRHEAQQTDEFKGNLSLPPGYDRRN